jgi:hypothetical protein
MNAIETHFNAEWQRIWLKFILEHFPDAWKYIGGNPNVSMETIQTNLDKDWDWNEIAKNPNITVEMLQLHPELLKNRYFLEYNPNIPIEMIRMAGNLSGFLWQQICRNPSITMKMVNENLDLPWDWEIFSSNPYLTIEMIENNPTKGWNWHSIAKNPNIPIGEIYKKKCGLLWEKIFGLHSIIPQWIICENPNITTDMINLDLICEQTWNCLSRNPAITMEFIEQNINLPLEDGLPHSPWNWIFISMNPNINIEFIKKHKHNISWLFVSKNRAITMDDINNNPDFPWSWYGISGNPNLTMDMIKKHSDKKWSWELICDNPLSFEKQNFIAERIQKILLLVMHEFYQDNPLYVETLVEYVLFDCYIMKYISRY